MCTGESDDVVIERLSAPLELQEIEDGNNCRVDESHKESVVLSRRVVRAERRVRAWDDRPMEDLVALALPSPKRSALFRSVYSLWCHVLGCCNKASYLCRRITRPKLCITRHDIKAPAIRLSGRMDSGAHQSLLTIKSNPIYTAEFSLAVNSN